MNVFPAASGDAGLPQNDSGLPQNDSGLPRNESAQSHSDAAPLGGGGRRRGGARPRSTSLPDARRQNAQERGISLPPDAQWSRVHPITPLLEGWKGITAVLAVLVWQNAEYMLEAYSSLQTMWGRTASRVIVGAGLGMLGLLVLVGVALWLAWRMRSFAVDHDAVYLRTGVLNRKLRTARLPRIQSVDIIHPLLGRIFGLGRLKVEVAGGGDSHVLIGFLRTRELEELRDRILSLAAGAQLHGEGEAKEPSASTGPGLERLGEVGEPHGAGPRSLLVDPDGAAGPGSSGRGMHAPGELGRAPGEASSAGGDQLAGAAADRSAPRGFEDAMAAQPIPKERLSAAEHYLYEVDSRILIGSMLRSGVTLATAAVLVGFLVLVAVWLRIEAFQDTRALAVFFSVLPMLTIPLGLGAYAWSRFDKGWRFRAAATPAGIRTRFGLTAETSSTLPPGRVHGVQIEQGPLWRGPDWWRVEVSVAGRSAAEVKSSGVEDTGANVLLPVGRRETALRALWLVVPDLGVADPDAFLEVALTGSDHDGVGDVDLDAGAAGRGFIRISPRGRPFSPLAWRREAIALTDTCVVLRLGRWWRRISVIPYERIQSLRLVQGPLARRRGLAALHLDMVDAEISRTLSNLDLADAAAVERVISERALRRRRRERLDRWLARATEVG
ncbi:PH domain-containing protein [Actinomyces sp. 594]|uniref:PH domain-containing protein n=1 Tax=Actinomyces sp. 594 TaxID=2057793 RepID=UPI001C57E3CC|nr:PH domain-containing protein [Actinomyces sp. 594]MBW3068750.1 PH domain-containing protein [Actinomyces sp. 594]